jgi:hypothetical protein
LEPPINANKNDLRSSAFIGGFKLFLVSSVVPVVPPWFNSSRISLANLGVLGG